MAKVINYWGKLDNGGIALDVELHPKRIKDFIPFEIERYSQVINFIHKNNPDLNFFERLEMIDKLLFSEEEIGDNNKE